MGVYDNFTSLGTISIPVYVSTTWGFTLLGPCYARGEHVHYYQAGEYGVRNCKFTSTIKLYSSTVEIPVNYNVGTTGSNWSEIAYVQDNLTTVDDSWKLKSPYSIISGTFGAYSTFSFVYGSSQASSVSLSVSVNFGAQNVSFNTYGTPRSDSARPPTITGNRNSPISGDTGGNTSVQLSITRYYKTDKWTCATTGATASWGGAISGAYFNGSSITLKGSLYCYKSTLNTFLDTLPIPEAPIKTSTDSIQLVDDSVSPAKTENLSVTRTRKYTFYNWNTKADGTGTAYGTGGKALNSNGFKEDTTLYAQWKDATVSSTSLPDNWTSSKRVKNSNTPTKTALLECFYNTAKSNEVYDSHTAYQYEFKGVKLTGWKGTDGSEIAPGSPAGGCEKYTAVWSKDSSSSSTYSWENNKYTPIVPAERTGWTYLGLSTAPTSKDPEYQHPVSNITFTSDMDLYAVWKANGSGHLFDGTSYKMYQIYIYDGNNWKLYLPKIYNGSDWETIYM